MSQVRSKNEEKDAKFYISREDWNIVIAYAESAYHQMKSEIGGQMVIVEDEEGDFILKDPIILKQEVSGMNCEMEEEALALHYSKMVSKYGNKVRHCWWHSHHTMGAYWSGTDNGTILGNETQDFSVSLVVNLKQEYKLRVQFFYPFEHEENIILNFIDNIDEIRDEALDTEVKKLCTKSVTAVTTTKGLNGKPYVDGQQTTMWTKEDQAAVDMYNYGYGYNYGYRRNYEGKVDMHKVPADKVKPINDLIEEVQDKIIDDTCTYQQFLEMRKTVNESIKEYNIQMKLMSKDDLEACSYHYWPEDFLENIKGRDTVVHK